MTLTKYNRKKDGMQITVSVDGIEPSASVLSGQRSTTELHAQVVKKI